MPEERGNTLGIALVLGQAATNFAPFASQKPGSGP